MKRIIYDYNQLLRAYNKYRRKLLNLRDANKNERRQLILKKRIARMHEKLQGLYSTLKLTTAAAGVVIGTLLLTTESVSAQTTFLPKQVNPFGISNSGYYNSSPAFADIDGDGDLDMISFNFYYGYDYDTYDYIYENRFKYYENTGTAENPVFAAPVVNPFGITGGGTGWNERLSPTFVDIDGDGDMDIVFGNSNGDFYYLENTGSATNPSFEASELNPFGLTSTYGGNSKPTFVDIDGDGDLDMISGSNDGGFYYFENTGSSTAPAFAAPVVNPFELSGLTGFSPRSAPAFVDIDGDGDFDMVSGDRYGDFYYFENIGTNTDPEFAAPELNPFSLESVDDNDSAPTFVDLDNDGDMDLMAGDGDGNFTFFENCPSTSSTINVDAACFYVSPSGQYLTSSGTYLSTIQNTAGCDSLITINLTVGPISDQTVTAANPVICGTGSTTIDLGASQEGVSYYLRDNNDDSVIDGPVIGDGSAISFNTGVISDPITYNVYGEITSDIGIAFDGVGSNSKRINCGNDPSVQLSGNQITLEAWVYPTEWKNQVHQGAIINKEINGWLNDFGYMIRAGNNGQVNFNLGNSQWNELNSPQGVLSLDAWQHVAATYDGTDMKIYVNGVEVASKNDPNIDFSSADSDLTIGNWSNGNGSYFVGTIDEVRVWSVTKTETEIQENMNSCLSGSETGLAAYYRFENGAGGSIVSDLTPNQNTGTLQNMDVNEVWVDGAEIGCIVCDLEMTETASISFEPALEGTDNTTICNNESVVINGTTYDALNPTGVEVFENVGPYGCDSTVTVNLNVLPALEGTDNTTICNNESVVINGTTYDAMNPTGTEIFSNIGPNGCDSTVTVNLDVLPAINTTTTVSEETVTADLSGATYQWVDCNDGNSPIAEETNQSFTVTENGDYAVEITVDGCMETSECVTFSTISVASHSLNDELTLYPNPTNGLVQITIPNSYLGRTIELMNVMGQVLESKSIQNETVEYDLHNMANGIYFIQIRTENSIISKKVIKN